MGVLQCFVSSTILFLFHLLQGETTETTETTESTDTGKDEKVQKITRVIASGHSYNLYRVKEDGGMELVKSNIILPTKRITDKLVKNVMKEEEVSGNCTLVYIHSIEKKYEMSVSDFMKYGTEV